MLLAGDSQYSTYNGHRQARDAKVVALSEVLAVAYCGSGRLGQLLTYHMDELDDPPLGRDEHRWAVKEFIPYLRGVAGEHGHLHIHHNVEMLGESAFLLAVRGALFLVDSDLGIANGLLSYEALGSGEEVAIGALREALGDTHDPIDDRRLERVATNAVTAATELTNFVGGPINQAKTVIYTADEKSLAREMLGRR